MFFVLCSSLLAVGAEEIGDKAEVSSDVTLFRGLLHLPREFSPKLPGFDVLETFDFHNGLVRFLYSASLPLAGLMNRPLTNEELHRIPLQTGCP